MIQLFLLCFIFFSSASLAEDGWELVHEDEGIKTYRRTEGEAGLFSVKIMGLIKAPPEKVLWVLNDIHHLDEWVQGLESASIIEKKPPDQLVIYHC